MLELSAALPQSPFAPYIVHSHSTTFPPYLLFYSAMSALSLSASSYFSHSVSPYLSLFFSYILALSIYLALFGKD